MPSDAKPTVKGTNKLPKWVLPVGAVVIIGGTLYLKKRSANAPAQTGPESEQQALNRQSFIPVTGENVAGVGAGGVGAVSGSENNAELIKEVLSTDRESQAEGRRENQELLRTIIANLGTGGGAPTSQGPGGVVTAPPPGAGTPPGPVAPAPAPPAPPPRVATCPSSFPHLNGSSPSPHTCYQNMTCGNGCAGHRYQDGHADCQTKTGGKCHW